MFLCRAGVKASMYSMRGKTVWTKVLREGFRDQLNPWQSSFLAWLGIKIGTDGGNWGRAAEAKSEGRNKHGLWRSMLMEGAHFWSPQTTMGMLIQIFTCHMILQKFLNPS